MEANDKPVIVPPRGIPFSPSAICVRWRALSPEGVPAKGYDRIRATTDVAVGFVKSHLQLCGYTEIEVRAIEGPASRRNRKYRRRRGRPHGSWEV